MSQVTQQSISRSNKTLASKIANKRSHVRIHTAILLLQSCLHALKSSHLPEPSSNSIKTWRTSSNSLSCSLSNSLFMTVSTEFRLQFSLYLQLWVVTTNFVNFRYARIENVYYLKLFHSFVLDSPSNHRKTFPIEMHDKIWKKKKKKIN